ncbi:MAG: T9SS type A sorting domain-containing protein [Ignavibacteriaceae bacterium]|nr:T9SS type A sorting domain-containing protein [Ignavibacteriaceae bacterium]NUM70728.1 T9SS type A sorting domain-containing protein [Ignavibacteriaceae bacterium]
MKKFVHFLILFVFVLGINQSSAQGNRIKLELGLNLSPLPTFIIATDTVREGVRYILPQKVLTGNYSQFQTLYNGLAGSNIMWEDGSIPEDITVRLTISNLAQAGGVYGNVMFGGNPHAPALYWKLEVYDWNGIFPLGNPEYYFTNNKYFRISIRKTASWQNFLLMQGIPVNGTMVFGFYSPGASGLLVGLDAITENYNDSLVVKVRHFSEIAGFQNTVPLSVKEVTGGTIPADFTLNQNYPNPFNPSTNINFSVPFRSQVQLKIFNVVGNEIATLVNEVMDAGNYNYSFDAGSLPSGVYFYKMTAGNITLTRKMVLMK